MMMKTENGKHHKYQTQNIKENGHKKKYQIQNIRDHGKDL